MSMYMWLTATLQLNQYLQIHYICRCLTELSLFGREVCADVVEFEISRRNELQSVGGETKAKVTSRLKMKIADTHECTYCQMNIPAWINKKV